MRQIMFALVLIAQISINSLAADVQKSQSNKAETKKSATQQSEPQKSLPKHFGVPIVTPASTSLDTVLTAPEKHLGRTVVAEATVQKVCQKKGCWMEVSGAKERTRVTFKDYGFFVPPEILNKKVVIQGKLKEETLSVKEQRHYLEDEGASKAAIDAIKEPKTSYSFVADGVMIQ